MQIYIKGGKQMNKITLEKIEKLFMYFIMYSVIGWTYEVFLETVIYKWGFSNRGVLFGPYCPVYGFGVLIFLFTVYPTKKKEPPIHTNSVYRLHGNRHSFRIAYIIFVRINDGLMAMANICKRL